MDLEKQALALSRRHRCEVEIFRERSRELTVSSQKGGMHANDAAFSEGFAVRTIRDRRLGFYSFENAGELGNAVEKSLALAKKQEAADYFFPVGSGKSGKFFDGNAETGGEREAEAVRDMLQAHAEAGVRPAQNIAGASVSEQELVNSGGGAVSQKFSRFFAVSQCSFGDSEGNDSLSSARSGFSAGKVAWKAAEFAKASAGAGKIGGGKMRVVFDVRALGQLLHLFLPFNFSGESLRKKLTKLEAGKTVARKNISVFDDPSLKGGINPLEYDGEGFRAKTLPLVLDGKVENFLYDMKTAVKSDRKFAGRGLREGHDSAPAPSFTNISIKGGQPADLVSECTKGLYVSSFLTSGANPVTGDFSFPLLVAAEIRDGGTGRAVKSALMKGNFFSLLKSAEFERAAAMHNGLKSGRMAAELEIIS